MSYVCPGCQANGMAYDCFHDEKMWALAEALSVGLPGGPAKWGTPVDRAWAFIDDAEALVGSVGNPPYRVGMFHPAGRQSPTTVGVVNGRYLFTVDEEAEFIVDVLAEDGRNQLLDLLTGIESQLPAQANRTQEEK